MAGRRAIITGGSRGMGAATVMRFVEEGWDVTFTYRSNEAGARAVVERCSVVRPGSASARQLDLKDADAILGFWRTLDEDGDHPRAVVNNAAVTGPKTSTADLQLDDLVEVTTTNWIGTVLFTREAVRRMSTARGGMGGAIVNVSSTAVRIGAPHQWVHYASLKGAIDVFTNGLARELAEEGIRVNAVSPGYTLTDPARTEEIVGRFDRMRHEVPMGRIGTVDEVAAAIYWLCTDEASYVTGAVLPVAGGR